jgi:hypothetical protein
MGHIAVKYISNISEDKQRGHVGSEALSAVTMKKAVFWGMTLQSDIYCYKYAFYSEDGCSK